MKNLLLVAAIAAAIGAGAVFIATVHTGKCYSGAEIDSILAQRMNDEETLAPPLRGYP